MPFDPISYILGKKGIKLPTLKNLVIDADKDWQGYRIINLGEPIDPNDAARKIYVDVATTGLGINYYLLDAADSEVSAYKQLSLTPPEASEAYVETTQNSAGDYEIASWIAPADATPILRLGVYTLHFQAEKVSGNIDVRFFFRLYERDSEGNETLISESSLSDLVTDRRNVIVGLVLPHDYEMSEGSRLVVKVYARYLSSGSNTTIRLYYQGSVRSRLATPIAKEVLDTIYAAKLHAIQHSKGGADELLLDASQITSGIIDVARIPDLSRSKITDIFSAPFWDNIPDKPSVFPPDLHASAHAKGGVDELSLDASQITSGVLSAARIPNLDASKITSGVFDVDRIPDLVRSKITDFFSSPFWDNIPDKPFSSLGSEFSVSNEELQINSIDFNKITNRVSSLITFDSSLIPNADNSYDFGSISYRWANAYVVNGHYYGNVRIYNGKRLRLQRTASVNTGLEFYDENNDRKFVIVFDTDDYVSLYDDSIGGSVWKCKYNSGILKTRDIQPNINNRYNLGSSSNRWKDGWYSGNLGLGVIKEPGTNLTVDVIAEEPKTEIASYLDENQIRSGSWAVDWDIGQLNTFTENGIVTRVDLSVEIKSIDSGYYVDYRIVEDGVEKASISTDSTDYVQINLSYYSTKTQVNLQTQAHTYNDYKTVAIRNRYLYFSKCYLGIKAGQ